MFYQLLRDQSDQSYSIVSVVVFSYNPAQTHKPLDYRLYSRNTGRVSLNLSTVLMLRKESLKLGEVIGK